MTSYHIEAPIGTAIGMVFMNRDIWEELPPEAREVIMRHSGEDQTRILGRFFDAQNDAIRTRISGMDGHVLAAPDPQQAAQWETRLAPVTESWLARTEGGAALLERFTRLLEDAATD
ncbi:hypothetical protein [Roseinatronobacter sp. S2]|uniref:hypothetical protein n=2 Tax=Roseinatronobacter sp. S2 TaxID=3035471 RepID=UPI0024109982|nr:hypothetical protein [Roseinatronobacter sp. S2]WFE76527.1 hypothetical protein P8S53_18565 [Roseinatronobacter sp. S2]